jgi:class 3 adenylate cyclase
LHRKVVTVLFCDVVGSTALGESTDPEALQGLLAAYFERMKAIVEHHGGSVEKFIGDAVMAVFGVPAVHEDDALRACRAAVEMRSAFPQLGIEGRIGVNTGEVVTGTEERLATGDAVNVAARLQQAAEPNEVLIGLATVELVRDAAEVEPAEPLDLKGKAEPVSAFRLVAVAGASERSHESVFVGREREVATIRDAWQRAVAERRCELVTIVGDPGIGKTRLAAEALAGLDARAVRGRCLPYGDGITYWAIVELVKQLDALPADPAAAAAIHSLLGETDAASSADEIAWAFRKLLEQEAPLVAVVDDVQWADDTLIELLEAAALLSSDAPILLVCVARAELLDRRPEWPVSLRLEPLPDDAVDELISTVAPELRERIALAAGGNPLFLTEMLAMAEHDSTVEVPATLRALLSARLDQLEHDERRVLEAGAVEGELFHRGAVQALAPDEPQTTPRLAALVRRQVIRPDRAQLPGEDGFRFRHILIRDAAYDALPKATRAELHARFADWLEERGAELVELDEILGYHLEQAARYREELGTADPALADRAAGHLAAAGQRADERGARRAAGNLLSRSLGLTRPRRLDINLEIALADVQGPPSDRAEIADAAAQRAREAGDEAAEALARVVANEAREATGEDEDLDAHEREANDALRLLAADDHVGRARVLEALSTSATMRGRFEEATKASEQALRHLGLVGRAHRNYVGVPGALTLGPRPADECLAWLDANESGNPSPRLVLLRARLLAMLGRGDEAWELAVPAAERLHELTGEPVGSERVAEIAMLRGEPAAAAEYLARSCELFERTGDRAFLSTYAPALGRALCKLGRHDEAEAFALRGRELTAEDDLASQILWRQVLALVHSARGEHTEAERLAREAVEIAAQTDALNFQGDALCDLGEVLAAAGRVDEAVAALEEAADRYERKRNLALLAQVHRRLDALRQGATA